MKKNIVISLVLFLLIGCKKDNEHTSNSDRLFDVTFTAKEFQQDLTVISEKKATNLVSNQSPEDYFRSRYSRIRFLIFNSNGDIAINLDRSMIPYLNEETTEDFWKFNIQLAKGTYKVGAVFYNAEEGAPLFIKDKINGNHYLDIFNLSEEVFVKKFTEFVVSSDSTYSPIELNRLNGLLMVQLSDAVKSEAASFRISYSQYSIINPFLNELYIGDEENYFTQSLSFSLKDSVGKENTIFQTPILPKSSTNGSNFDITLSLFDNKGKLIGSKKVNNVLIKSNYRTKLTGPIFDLITETPTNPESKNKSNFKIEMNTIYNNNIINKEFE